MISLKQIQEQYHVSEKVAREKVKGLASRTDPTDKRRGRPTKFYDAAAVELLFQTAIM